MTAPRQVLRAATYLVSRRTFHRQFLLRPSAEANELFLFILAVAAKRYGILLHAFCVLSNHYHLVLTDPLAQLPAFEQYLDSLVARAINCAMGRWETFWAPPVYSAVRLVTPEDILDKTAYCLANPVAAGLVRHGSEWPGLWSSPHQIGNGSMEAKRPLGFFRSDGPTPESVSLGLTCPPGFDDAEEFRAQLIRELEKRERQSAREMERDGRSFLGARKVLAQKPTAGPAAGEPRRGLSPRIACRDRWKRMEALGMLSEFRRAHRRAWSEFTKGLREVVFPPGTYWARVVMGARCAAAG
jgi:putative transposase